FGILAGDAVGERVQVRLAGDDRAEGAKPFDDPRIARGYAVAVTVERDAAGGGRAGEIEAVLYGDGEPPERVAAVAEGAAFRARHLFGALGFAQGPLGIAPQIGVAAGVPIGVGQGCFSQTRGSGEAVGEGAAQ